MAAPAGISCNTMKRLVPLLPLFSNHTGFADLIMQRLSLFIKRRHDVPDVTDDRANNFREEAGKRFFVGNGIACRINNLQPKSHFPRSSAVLTNKPDGIENRTGEHKWI